MPYEPWIGANYTAGAFFGQRLLIVGESHCGDDDPGLTQAAVRDACKGYHWQFLGQIGELFVGRSSYREDRARFWNSVAFLNFVDEPAGEGAKDRPTLEMFVRARDSFLNRIARIDPLPDRLIVFGSEAWQQFPDFSGERKGHRYVEAAENKEMGLYGVYRIGGHEVLATYANHPSAWKFQKSYGAAFWHRMVWRFLTVAPVR